MSRRTWAKITIFAQNEEEHIDNMSLASSGALWTLCSFRHSGRILVRSKRREPRNNTASHPGKMESSTLSTCLTNVSSLFHFLSPKGFGLSHLQRLWLLAPGLLQYTSLTFMYLQLHNQSVYSYTTSPFSSSTLCAFSSFGFPTYILSFQLPQASHLHYLSALHYYHMSCLLIYAVFNSIPF